MDLKEIKAVIDLMTKNGLTEFELEKADFKIRVRRGAGGEGGGGVLPAPMPVAPVSVPVAALPPAATAGPAAAPASGGAAETPAAGRVQQIVSPMVGTFYGAPSPESEPYVKVGSEVNEDTVVCIIEAMKVMNEIKAETTGIITEILAANGKPVEFGKPLFSVRPK